jgi:hypothetical protein
MTGTHLKNVMGLGNLLAKASIENNVKRKQFTVVS